MLNYITKFLCSTNWSFPVKIPTHRERKIIWTEILDRSDWKHFKVCFQTTAIQTCESKNNIQSKLSQKSTSEKAKSWNPTLQKNRLRSPTKSFSNKWPAKGFARQISNLHTMSLRHLWWSLNNKVDCYESFFLPWKFSSKSRLISSLKW